MLIKQLKEDFHSLIMKHKQRPEIFHPENEMKNPLLTTKPSPLLVGHLTENQILAVKLNWAEWNYV